MLGFLIGWWRAKAARPLLWWTLALILFVVLPVPQHPVLFLIMGLGVALTVTVRRLRDGGRRAVDGAARVWDIADQIGTAVADRIRQAPPQVGRAPYGYGEPAQPQLAPVPATYDPGALLSAVTAVLSAEGLPVNAGAALSACADLLTWQGVALAPGVPAPTARALTTQLAPGAARRYRAAPPAMLAACVAAILVADGVLPAQLAPDEAAALVEGAVRILDALNIAPDSRAGTLEDWPIMADIIAAAPHQHGAW